MPKRMTLDQLLEYIRSDMDKSGLSQRDYAASIDVTDSYLSDVLHKHRSPGPKLLAGLGMRELESQYERIKE